MSGVIGPAPLSAGVGLTTNPVKTKSIVTAWIIAAGLGGFWFGSYQSTRGRLESLQFVMDRDAREESLKRAQVNLRLLSYLRSGEQSKAADLLERQLEVAVIQCAAYARTVTPPEDAGRQLWTIHEARDYRLQHPWTNDPVSPEGLQKAFQLVH
jgi:hypothetical protein